MKWVAAASAVTISLTLTGCASTASLAELHDAERAEREHAAADIFIDVDLVERGAQNEAERAPLIKQRRALASQCEQKFHADFTRAIDEAGDTTVDGVLRRVERLESEFGACIRPFGLTGYPEFQVGDRFMRAPVFVRSWWHATARVARAQSNLAGERDANLSAMALGWMMSRDPAAQPPAAVNCTSYRVGAAVQTTCK